LCCRCVAGVLQVRSSVSSARCSSTHTATHTATKCNTLQHRYTCYQRLTNCSFLFCNTLQHTATQIYLPPAPHELQLPVLQHTCNRLQQTATDGNRLQHTATQIHFLSAPHELQLFVLQHTVTHCNTHLQHRSTSHQRPTNCSFLFCITLQQTATDGNRLQQTAAHCNTDLPLISTSRTAASCSTAHCNTLQHTAAHTATHTATQIYLSSAPHELQLFVLSQSSLLLRPSPLVPLASAL